ncbi:unnamed protein product [Clavelina lepadiformis]|uniref:Uncharacterized protein n=1 Tax=Clavelina lepadiformis TaxID=159417 RepID=A0ABP0FC27_CLALP
MTDPTASNHDTLFAKAVPVYPVHVNYEKKSKARKLDIDAVTIQKLFEEREVMKNDYQPMTRVYQASLSVKARNGSYYDVPRLEEVVRLIFKDRPCSMLVTKP